MRTCKLWLEDLECNSSCYIKSRGEVNVGRHSSRSALQRPFILWLCWRTRELPTWRTHWIPFVSWFTTFTALWRKHQEHRLSPHSSKSRPHTFPSETQTASPCCCWMLSFKLPNQPSLAEFTLIIATGMQTKRSASISRANLYSRSYSHFFLYHIWRKTCQIRKSVCYFKHKNLFSWMQLKLF